MHTPTVATEAEVAEYARMKRCMTTECIDCPLSKLRNRTGEYCDDFCKSHPEEAMDLLGESFEDYPFVPFDAYECQICGEVIESDEQMLWGHIQLWHEKTFDDVQDLGTPDMVDEFYKKCAVQVPTEFSFQPTDAISADDFKALLGGAT